MSQHQFPQQGQLAMKEVPATRHHQHRQCLWARPLHHGLQRHGVVVLAMNDQCAQTKFIRNFGDIEPAGRRTDHHHPLNVPLTMQGGHRTAGNKTTKRKAGKTQRTIGNLRMDDREHVIQLATPFIVDPFTRFYATEVEPHSRPATENEGARQRLHDLVGQGAPMQGMGMCNDGHPARRTGRTVYGHLQQPGGTRLNKVLGVCVHVRRAANQGF